MLVACYVSQGRLSVTGKEVELGELGEVSKPRMQIGLSHLL